MAKLIFKTERCKGCGLCVVACPKSLLSMSNTFNQAGYAVVTINDMKACTGCHLCAEMCPDVVISVYV